MTRFKSDGSLKWFTRLNQQLRLIPGKVIIGIATMYITKKYLPRRTVLKGLGTALALPLLDLSLIHI